MSGEGRAAQPLNIFHLLRMDHPPPLKDLFSSFLPQQGQNSPFSLQDSPVPSIPQSPNNSQLNMSLINNLIQMQGLENSIVQQQLSTASSSSAAGQNASPRATYNSQLLLEHQIKMAQLQQLQHLQKQIFQQQVYTNSFLITSCFLLTLFFRLQLSTANGPRPQPQPTARVGQVRAL